MLRYAEVQIDNLAVPGERCLCIYISGCMNHCKNCHYPELQNTSYGDKLADYFNSVIAVYRNRISCVCFMGEGIGDTKTKKEFRKLAKKLKKDNLKSCLYSGRNTKIEKWMYVFDYIKVGSYQEEYGSLTEETTNQRMYKKAGKIYTDITSLFWEKR